MAALVTAETLAIVLLAVLVAGLLRSHARILAALHRLGVPLDASDEGGQVPGPAMVELGTRPGERSAADVVGVTPDDQSVSLAVGSSGVDTLLAFLSSGCSTCAELWSATDAAERSLPDRTRIVVVTLSPDQESPARVRRLASPHATVVMSSDAWQDYRVPGAPYFVLVAGATGRIAGEGSARTWSQVASLMGDAAEAGGSHHDRVDVELARAGIHPGDPRLYDPPIAGRED